MEHREPKYDGSALMHLRQRHDDFVDAQAARLGVEPSAILTAVKDFGFCAADIAELTDKSGLTKYANGHGLNIIGFEPVRYPRVTHRREFTAPKPKTEKKVRPGRAERKRAKVRGEKSSKWAHDRGATSMGEAMKRVGLTK